MRLRRQHWAEAIPAGSSAHRGRCASLRRQPHDDLEMPVALEHHAGFASADGGADHVLHRREAEAAPRDFRLVDRDLQHRQDRAICSTLTSVAPSIARRMRGDLVGGPQQRLELVAEYLHRDVAAHACKQLIESHLDRLREFVGVAGQCASRRARSAATSASLVSSGSGHSSCGFRMMKVSEAFGGIGSEAISAVPVFENTNATCGKLADGLLDLELHRLRLGQAGAGNAQRMHGDVLFVQRRDELLAKPL